MIAFKQPESIDEWNAMHPRLREVLLWVHAKWGSPVMVITRILRPQVPGETGVHRTLPHRAADIRTNDIPEVEGAKLMALINEAWDYGDGKHNVALQHGDGDNRHLHLQVRNETRRTH